MRTPCPREVGAAYRHRAGLTVAERCYRDRPTVLQSGAFPRFARHCNWSMCCPLPLHKCTRPVTYRNEYLAYLCGILQQRRGIITGLSLACNLLYATAYVTIATWSRTK